jgi:Putative peptidoglycan binding domain
MKIPKFNSLSRIIAGSLAAAFVLVAVPNAAQADPKWKKKHHDRGDDRYYRVSRSSYTVTYGTGWRGRGYYYGPPGAAFFYETPGVAFYTSRGAVPVRYWGGRGGGYSRPMSLDAQVQRALARRGYYNGPVDGDVGPGTRRAIARYQARNGLQVTGTVTRGLTRSLGL